MIIVQLKGGLGNQLFQYAAGLSLAHHHNQQLKVDVNELRTPDEEIGTIRNFELQNLIEPPDPATDEEVEALTKQAFVTKYLQKLLPSYQRTIYNEKQFSYDVNFFKSKPAIYLKGYRQSEKYFNSIRSEIQRKFQFKPFLIDKVFRFGNSLKNQDSVSIHIRRGDYTNSIIDSYHGVTSKEYYQQAINRIKSTIPNPTFYIFSDSMQWVKDNLQFGIDVTFMSGSISLTHYEDFHLMSCCRHNIIANSSFSWWAAWLNDNKEKIVIAPVKWFAETAIDTTDLLPTEWIKL